MRKLSLFAAYIIFFATITAQAEDIVRCTEHFPEPNSRIEAIVAELDDGDTIKVRAAGRAP